MVSHAVGIVVNTQTKDKASFPNRNSLSDKTIYWNNRTSALFLFGSQTTHSHKSVLFFYVVLPNKHTNIYIYIYINIYIYNP